MEKELEQLYRKGIEHLENEQFEDAIRFFNHGIEKCKENSNFWCARGVALLRRADRDWDNALIAFEVALEKDPENFHAWVSRGEALGRKGAYLEALYSFDRAIALTDSYKHSDDGSRKMYIEAQNGKAWVLIDGFNEFDKALKCCSEVFKLDKGNHVAKQNQKIAKERKVLGHSRLVRGTIDCPSCKTTLYELSKYCPNCGNKLTKELPSHVE